MNKAKLSTARELHAQGNFKAALDAYEGLLVENPGNAELLHLIGILHAQLNQTDLALTYINQAIEAEPNAAFYNSQGNVFRRLNRLESAIKSYQKAIELKPDYTGAYNNLGLMHYQQKDFTLAKDAYSKALELSPNFVNALLNSAILCAHLGELEESREKLERAFELDAHNPKILGQLAQVYLSLNEPKKALIFFDEKLKTMPEDANTYYDIGLCLLKIEEYSDAIKSLEMALALQSPADDLYHHLATAYLYENDVEKALNYYFRQLEIKPLMESYYNIGVLLMNKNRSKEAITYLEHAASLDSAYFPVHVNLGALYLKHQHLAKAIEHYQIALSLHPEDAEISHILSALQKDKTPDAAPKEYLQRLFDQYATFYEKHLTQHLKYQVPEKIYAQIFEEIGIETPSLQILDLGCGTGLCGSLFRKMAKKLIGIDISEKMLTKADEKKIYDELAALDVNVALETYQHNDIILAADVFTYIGNLSTIFEKAHEALNENGLFAFSVEKTSVEAFELQHSIRYAHSKNYLNNLIKKNNFNILRFENLILRQQRNKAVEGYLLLLKKQS
jgi:predicted TPR repeat methyltransferase